MQKKVWCYAFSPKSWAFLNNQENKRKAFLKHKSLQRTNRWKLYNMQFQRFLTPSLNFLQRSLGKLDVLFLLFQLLIFLFLFYRMPAVFPKEKKRNFILFSFLIFSCHQNILLIIYCWISICIVHKRKFRFLFSQSIWEVLYNTHTLHVIPTALTHPSSSSLLPLPMFFRIFHHNLLRWIW